MSGNNPPVITASYLTQQPFLPVRRARPAARIRAVIDNEQARPDTLRQRGKLPGRGVMGAPIALPLSRHAGIGSSPGREDQVGVTAVWSVCRCVRKTVRTDA